MITHSLTATNRHLPILMAALVIALTFITSMTKAGEHLGAELSGHATIIDGDTIDIDGQRIRFHGIDAPEARQTCIEDGEDWSCGQQSTLALIEFINQSPVTCEGQGTDRYSRIIATCYVRGDDIEAWMVSSGWAVAYRKYSLDYTDEEARAQAAGVGMWRGEFVLPWDWRKGERTASLSTDEQSRQELFPAPTQLVACCKTCHKGKACGNSCINRSYSCTRPPGCACNGN